MTTDDRSSVSAKFVETLVRGIGHDMGAPARHVAQFGSLLDRSGDTALSNKQKQWLHYIIQGGQQMQAMLEALSVIGQLASDQRPLTKLNLTTLAEQTILRFQNTPKYANTTFNLYTDEQNHHTVLGSQTHWHTLMCSLIENACLYRPLEPASFNSEVDVRIDIESESGELVFQVSDNGIGVPENQIPSLCFPFKRLNKREDYDGLGMGLSYCQLIAELNNADLTFCKSSSNGFLVRYSEKNPAIAQQRQHHESH